MLVGNVPSAGEIWFDLASYGYVYGVAAPLVVIESGVTWPVENAELVGGGS